MKLAVSGKGGVGKTTIAALVAAELASRGVRVTAIDADPNPTLAAALGFPPGPFTPLLEMSDEIEERIGSPGGFIRMNPRVDDLVSHVGRFHDGIHLIVAGGITHGGAGCACPQGVLLRRVMEHVVLESNEAVIVDFEAGLEHLGRRTAEAVDLLLVVVDPSRSSAETAGRIRRLAAEIGITRVLAVGNRVRGPADVDYLAAQLDGIELIGWVPYSNDVIEAERAGRPVTDLRGEVRGAVARLTDHLEMRARPETGSLLEARS
jgi:CO dehydrogenase maturation factor